MSNSNCLFRFTMFGVYSRNYCQFCGVLRLKPPQLSVDQRANYGAPRFKPKMAKSKPKRSPTMLALDHFDFYYGPLFGEKWPSIRLGLLTQKKFMAVLNRYSTSYEVSKEILKGVGAINPFENFSVRDENGNDKIVRKKRKMEQQIANLEFMSERTENEEVVGPVDEEMDVASRTEAGLNQFQPSAKEIRFGRVETKKQPWEENDEITPKRLIYDSKFKITGLESVGAEELPTVDHLSLYPDKLEVFSHPRMRIDGFPAPIKDSKNISSWWLLDGASIVPVIALDLQEEDLVLDMCASPGGKSLMILQTGKFASLVCNDLSLYRLGQLKRALALHVPVDSEISSRVLLKRKDATSVETWTDIDMYDKVLLDAPCTTDRISANEDEGNVFALEKTTDRLDLPKEQTKMLINALRSLRVGGSVVYSTCSLAPTQNECVVENAAALARTNYGIECAERSLKRLEKTLIQTGLYRFSAQCQRGILVLPWILSNFGPMYVCKLQRTK